MTFHMEKYLSIDSTGFFVNCADLVASSFATEPEKIWNFKIVLVFTNLFNLFQNWK